MHVILDSAFIRLCVGVLRQNLWQVWQYPRWRNLSPSYYITHRCIFFPTQSWFFDDPSLMLQRHKFVSAWGFSLEVCGSVFIKSFENWIALECVAVCVCVYMYVERCESTRSNKGWKMRVLQCVAVRCSVLQCVAVCCSVLQCVAVCCSVCVYIRMMSAMSW